MKHTQSLCSSETQSTVRPMDSNCKNATLQNSNNLKTDTCSNQIISSFVQGTLPSVSEKLNRNNSIGQREGTVVFSHQNEISNLSGESITRVQSKSFSAVENTPRLNSMSSVGSSKSQKDTDGQCQSAQGTPVSRTELAENLISVNLQCQSAQGIPVYNTHHEQNTSTLNENGLANNRLGSLNLADKQAKQSNPPCTTKNNDSQSNIKSCQGEQLPHTNTNVNLTYGPNTVNKETIKQPLTVSNVSSACWYFHAKINDLQMPLLFDTGSPVSIISKDTYNQITNKPTLTPVDTTLNAANGSSLELLGQGVFELTTEVKTYNWTFLVANIQGNMGIIGQDFIEAKGKFIKQKSLIWRTKNGVIKLFKLHSSQVAKIMVTEPINIPPASEAFITAKTDYPLYEEIHMLEPSSISQKKGLLVAKSLINKTESSQVSVMNVTDKSIKLRPGDILGHACSVEEISEQETKPSCPSNMELPEHLKPLIENVSEDLSSDEKQQFVQLLIEYQDIFAAPGGQLGRSNIASHTIDVGDAKPIKIPPRKCPLAQREVIDKELDKMLEQNIVEPSDSPWSAPICLVKKSDGTYRFAIDFRGLNSVTTKDAYPLPNIRQIFDTLSGSKWYNTIDLMSGYWQLEMDPKSKKYTAFVTPTRGLYQFLVMPFGLCNAGATFERAIESCLGSLRWEKCICYLDDVIIFGSDFQTTLDNLRAVFSRFKQANLTLKPSKCKFFQRQVSFLGHIATESGTKCDPEKIEAILNWPRLKTSKEVKSFLGLVNFYRAYIPKCAEIAYPLNNLTKKHVKFKWDQECEDAFMKLKHSLTSSPVLAYPTPQGKLTLQTDASLYGIGAILSQEQDGKDVVLAYASKTLSKAQQNYCTTMRELLAVVYFVRYFKHYLMGRHFDIYTDHASLKWIKNFKDADGMFSRWLTVLDTYDFTIMHKKAAKMQHVDALSRIPPRKCKNAKCVDCTKKPPDVPLSIGSLVQGCNPDQQDVSQSTGEDAGALSTERARRGVSLTQRA